MKDSYFELQHWRSTLGFRVCCCYSGVFSTGQILCAITKFVYRLKIISCRDDITNMVTREFILYITEADFPSLVNHL